MNDKNFLFHAEKMVGSSSAINTNISITEYRESESGYHSDVYIDASFRPSYAHIPKQLALLMTFTIVDAIVDIRVDGIEGENFSERFRRLPSKSAGDIVFRETYRLLRVFRNGAAHNLSGFYETNDGIEVSYTGKGKRGADVRLSCGHSMLRHLNALCVIFIKNIGSIDRYTECYLCMLYRFMVSEIREFSDESGVPLSSVNCEVVFNPYVRHRVMNPTVEYRSANDEHTIRRHFGAGDVIFSSGEEYVVSLPGGETCIVPGQALSGDGRISSENLVTWKANKNGSLYPV